MAKIESQRSSDIAFKYPMIGLVGAPGEGKSVTAGTISKYAMDWPLKKLTKCDDVRWLQFDPDATASLIGHNMDVPVWDFSTWKAGEIMSALKNDISAEIAKDVANGVTAFVIDSASLFSKIMTRHRGQTLTGYDLWRQVGYDLADLFALFRDLPVAKVFTFHEKFVRPPGDNDKNAVMLRTKAESLGVEVGKIGLDIDGDVSKALFSAGPALILPCKKAKGPGGKDEYFLAPHDPVVISKTKAIVLADKEPPHLGKLLAKIRSAIAAAKASLEEKP